MTGAGTAPERTRLAWERTALALAAVVTALLRDAEEGSSSALVWVVGALTVTLALAAAAWTVADARWLASRLGRPPRTVALALISLATTMTAVAAMVLVLLAPPG